MFVFVFVLLLAFSIFPLLINVPEVKASTLTFTWNSGIWATASDDSATYQTAHDGVGGSTLGTCRIGQKNVSSVYYLYRGYVYFDTSALPDNAIIDSAVLSLDLSLNYSDVGFNVTIQSGQPTYPHNPLEYTDYYYQYYSGSGGSRNISEITGTGYWNITLNSDGYDMISLTGATKLCLRSSNDLDSVAPIDYEYIEATPANTKLYVEYSLPPSYSTLTVSSSSEINARFTVNGTNYYTPTYVSFPDGNISTLIAEQAKIYGGEGWLFDRWLVNGTDTYYTQSISLNITADTTFIIYYVEIPDLYYFYGPYDEETGLLMDENVTVTVYYHTDTYPPYSFEFNGSWVYPSSPQAMFFRFNFSDGNFREYWVDPGEFVLPVYIFWGNTTSYIINFLDTAGILNDYPFVTLKRYVNGTLYTVEKRKVDVYKSILANLIMTRTYHIYLGNEETSYVFGDLTVTVVTAIQLVVRSVDFPPDIDWAVMNKYLRIYGFRNLTAGSLVINYNDTKEDTTSVFISISNSSGEVYNTTQYTDSFSVEWASAVNSSIYYVEATITHGKYGTVEWKQVFAATAEVSPPFSLAFLGDWGFDSSMLFPALLCLCAAGSFSKLNAYVGAILMMITALALAWIGWFPVPASMLVAGFTFAILMGIIYFKRGVRA